MAISADNEVLVYRSSIMINNDGFLFKIAVKIK